MYGTVQDINWVIVFQLIFYLKNILTQNVICDPDIPSRLPPDHHLSLSFNPDEGARNCSEGEYLEWYWCSPCPDGSFRTRQMSREDKYSKCYTCQAHGMYEIITEPCTATRDSTIMCEDGFYRYQVPGKPCHSHCVLCDVCGVGKNMFKNFVGRECVEHNNPVCCESPDMVVVGGNCVRASHPTTLSQLTTYPSATALKEYNKIVFKDHVENSCDLTLILNRNLKLCIILATCYQIASAILKIRVDHISNAKLQQE